MEKKIGKMSNLDRAKQFAPFAALRGFGGVTAEKEIIKCDKPELSDEDCQRISDTLNKIKKGKIVSVKYFCDGFIYSIDGAITYFDSVFKKLRVIKTEIRFSDLIDIKIMEQEDD